MRPITTMAAPSRSMRRPLRASHTAKPRPSRPAIISAATTTSQERPAVTRSVVITCGAIAGSVTSRSSSAPSMPRSRATRKYTLGMFATAAPVESTTGKKAAMKIRKMAGGSPMPSHRMAKGIQASGERLRKKLTRGRNAWRARAEWPRSETGGHAQRHGEQEPDDDAEERRDGVVHEPAAPQLVTRPRATANGVREERLREEVERATKPRRRRAATGPASAIHVPWRRREVSGIDRR